MCRIAFTRSAGVTIPGHFRNRLSPAASFSGTGHSRHQALTRFAGATIAGRFSHQIVYYTPQNGLRARITVGAVAILQQLDHRQSSQPVPAIPMDGLKKGPSIASPMIAKRA